MLKQCQDSYSVQFTQFPALLAYHEETRKASLWERSEVKSLRVAALDAKSPLYEDKSGFDPSVSQEAIADTAENLGLAIQVGGRYFPLRGTAYKSLLDRAKINGTALPKLARAKLAEVLNSCLELHKDSALLLIRDEKVSAAHSGDSRDYSILEIDQLLDGLQKKMDERFPGNEFETGYSDHAITSASWKLPNQKEDLLSAYEKLLEAEGKKALAAKLMPGIRFSTSDTGVASAKVSALLMGLQYPIHMATVLENYYGLRGEVNKRIAQGNVPADAIWWHGEIMYRISVLETCQMFCKTAPITMEVKILQGHYKMLDAYVQCLALERRYGPNRGPDTQKERDAAQNNLGRVIADYRKRFSSFAPSSQESYSHEISKVVQTLLPAWLQYRNTFVPLKKKEKEASAS